MSQFPHELIRQVQICSRAAAGLPDYNPSDPTLPALPPLSAAVAAFDPSPPQLRCKNCKGRLLRGESESIICVYCGHGPQNDVVPDPICFSSTIGYQWLLRSLRLDGSEKVEPQTNKSEQEQQGQSSPQALIALSDFLNFKIPWAAEVEKQETGVSGKHSEESKRSSSLTGVAPDNFFFKSKSDVLSDVSTEEPFILDRVVTTSNKDFAAFDDQNLFQNVQSSVPAVSSFKEKTSEDFSGWEADFQSGDSENQNAGERSADHFTSFSPDSGNKFLESQSLDHSDLKIDFSAQIDTVFGPGKDQSDENSKDNPTAFPAFDDESSDFFMGSDSGNKFHESQSLDHSTGLEFDLSAQIDSVFGGPGKDPSGGKPKDNPEASPAFGDWNSDDVWNNLSSSGTHLTGGIDDNIKTKDDHTFGGYSSNLSTGADLFQDFGWQTTTNAETNENKTTDDKKMGEDSFQEWNSFTGSTSLQDPSKNEEKSLEIDLVGMDNKTTNDKTMDEDSFQEWNSFTGSTSLQDPSKNDEKSSEIDLFGMDNKLEKMDFGDFSQPNLFSTSTSNNNALTEEVNDILSENPASNWLSDGSSPSLELGEAAKTEDAIVQSTQAKDDVAMLISQMHDLSFMLETELSIPSPKD